MTIGRVDITSGGATFSYTPGGKDWGNLTGPGFSHQNIQMKHPSPEFNVAMEIYDRSDLAPATRNEGMIELFKSGDLTAVEGWNDAAPLPAGITPPNLNVIATIT